MSYVTVLGVDTSGCSELLLLLTVTTTVQLLMVVIHCCFCQKPNNYMFSSFCFKKWIVAVLGSSDGQLTKKIS